MPTKSAQRHKIMRQVLEVHGCALDDAPRARSSIRAAYDRLLPSIERTCSELSTPDRLQRIDRLEIDLGEVPLDALEAAVVERFDRVFAGRLAAAIRSAESAPADVDLELFTYFIRTGAVPWWADRSDRHLLETGLDAAIRRGPHAIRRAIEHAPDQHAVWRRIALAYPDRLLGDLLDVLAPALATAYPGLATQWLALIEIVASGRSYSKSVARTVWWEELLRAAQATRVPVPEALRFFRAILLRLASRLGLTYSSLVSHLHLTLDPSHVSIQPWVHDVVERLQDALAAHDHIPLDDAGNARASAASADTALEELLARCEEAPRRLDDGERRRLRVLLARLRPDACARAVARIRRTPEGVALLAESGLGRDQAVPGDARRQDALGPKRDVDESEAPVDLAFSDVGEIYVENAGLVILWPFLENFFAHLGLIEDKQFKDDLARQRAVGLLQYVASAEAAAPEYLVPLNKVLCGMAIDDVFDFGPPITDDEIEACTDLLTAAIHHAPILREMSIQGFRGSFLLRHGQLSVRDGSWLLRVERETYDIVLDRFPWSIAIVKLPWMAAIMPVEW